MKEQAGFTWVHSVFLFLLLISLLISCTGSPRVTETPIDRTPSVPEVKSPSLADEIRSLIEMGTPPSLLRALDLLRNRDVSDTELGRILSAVAVTFFKFVYPELGTEMPPIDPPPTHLYARIIKDVEKGNYTPAPASSSDFLELVLPFLSLLDEKRSERLSAALPDIERAIGVNPNSVLAYYFKGIILDRTGQKEAALSAYQSAYNLSKDCYPAGLSVARLLSLNNQEEEAVSLLTELLSRYPENQSVKKELATLYYRTGNWSRAEPALAELLQKDPRDKELLLMRATVLVEQGKYIQASPLLDAYGALDSSNPTYLYLRARLQAEGYRNRDAALTFLRSILRTNPSDTDANIYMARLLIESDRDSDRKEGEALLDLLLKDNNPEPNVLDLAVTVAIRRQNWTQAQLYNNQLLDIRRSSVDLFNAITILQGLKKYDQALLFAKELYDRDATNEESVYIYVLSLIYAEKKDDAKTIIEKKLVAVSSGSLKSKYYFLRSKLKGDEESVLNDLRSSLFEDPRNLDSLIAMLEIYHRRKDERRAVYYLKQALSLSPDNPVLQPYKTEYANQLN